MDLPKPYSFVPFEDVQSRCEYIAGNVELFEEFQRNVRKHFAEKGLVHLHPQKEDFQSYVLKSLLILFQQKFEAMQKRLRKDPYGIFCFYVILDALCSTVSGKAKYSVKECETWKELFNERDSSALLGGGINKYEKCDSNYFQYHIL